MGTVDGPTETLRTLQHSGMEGFKESPQAVTHILPRGASRCNFLRSRRVLPDLLSQSVASELHFAELQPHIVIPSVVDST